MTNLQYKNVTPEAVAALRAKLTSGGGATVTPSGSDNQFRIVGHGITSDATYDPATQNLSVSVVSKPWIMPISVIDKAVKEALAGEKAVKA